MLQEPERHSHHYMCSKQQAEHNPLVGRSAQKSCGSLLPSFRAAHDSYNASRSLSCQAQHCVFAAASASGASLSVCISPLSFCLLLRGPRIVFHLRSVFATRWNKNPCALALQAKPYSGAHRIKAVTGARKAECKASRIARSRRGQALPNKRLANRWPGPSDVSSPG